MTSQNANADPLPERMILSLERTYLLLLWFGAAGFFGLNIFFLRNPDPDDGFPFGVWFCLIVFGFFVVAATLELIVPTISYIELSRTGFCQGGALRRLQPVTPWHEIAKIEIYRWRPFSSFLQHRGVRISYVPIIDPTDIPSPWIYGRDADELAALMTRFRDRALKADAVSI